MATTQGPEGEGEGEGKSLREQLLQTQTRLSEMDADSKKKTMSIAHFQDRIATTEQALGNSKQEGKRLSKEKSVAESLITEKRAALEKLKFDANGYKQLEASTRQI